MNINIDNNDFKSLIFKNYRNKISFYNEKYLLYFYGDYRTPQSKINNVISNLSERNFSDKSLEKIFSEINGVCTIVAVSENQIKICLSIYHPTLKIFNIKNGICVTDSEFIEEKKISNKNTFLKLFSHHSYFFHKGLSNNAIDFLCPGSLITINKGNINDYNFSWYLQFDQFCSRNDHDILAEEIAEEFVNVFEHLDETKPNYLALSGGVDSALLLAASSKTQIQPFHMSDIYDDEIQTALSVSKYFKKKLKIIYQYGNRYSKLTTKTNIIENLEFNYDYMAKDSVFFFLNNSDAFIMKTFENSFVCSGDEFPTPLCIEHLMTYPRRRDKLMHFDKKKDQRYFFSISYLNDIIDNKKKFTFCDKIFKNHSSIHPYYYPILETLIDQNQKMIDKIVNRKDSFDIFNSNLIVNSLDRENNELLLEIKIDNSREIFNKILKSDFFLKNLRIPDPRTAQILFKFVKFLTGNLKTMHQNGVKHKKNYTNEAIGLNSKIILKFFSTTIDERLVNSAKWHVFKAFEIISGKKFEDLFVKDSLKNFNFIKAKLTNKVFSKIHNLPEFDNRFALINNKFLDEFLLNKKIIEKYRDFKQTNEYGKLMYEFPSNEKGNKELTQFNFWKINNIVNISERL